MTVETCIFVMTVYFLSEWFSSSQNKRKIRDKKKIHRLFWIMLRLFFPLLSTPFRSSIPSDSFCNVTVRVWQFFVTSRFVSHTTGQTCPWSVLIGFVSSVKQRTCVCDCVWSTRVTRWELENTFKFQTLNFTVDDVVIRLTQQLTLDVSYVFFWSHIVPKSLSPTPRTRADTLTFNLCSQGLQLELPEGVRLLSEPRGCSPWPHVPWQLKLNHHHSATLFSKQFTTYGNLPRPYGLPLGGVCGRHVTPPSHRVNVNCLPPPCERDHPTPVYLIHINPSSRIDTGPLTLRNLPFSRARSNDPLTSNRQQRVINGPTVSKGSHIFSLCLYAALIFLRLHFFFSLVSMLRWPYICLYTPLNSACTQPSTPPSRFNE